MPEEIKIVFDKSTLSYKPNDKILIGFIEHFFYYEIVLIKIMHEDDDFLYIETGALEKNPGHIIIRSKLFNEVLIHHKQNIISPGIRFLHNQHLEKFLDHLKEAANAGSI